MKFNVLRHLLIPWVLYFLIAFTAYIAIGVQLGIQVSDHPLLQPVLAGGVLFCLIWNFRTLQQAGIWITHGLPSNLRFSYAKWLGNAVMAAAVAAGFYTFGKLPWIPLFWHAFVLPATFAVALYVGIRGLLGPILKWSSNVAFGRTLVFVQLIPIVLLVPVTVVFLGEGTLKAYYSSRPDYTAISPQSPPAATSEAPEVGNETARVIPAESEKALQFKALVDSGQSCHDSNRDIQLGLDPKGPDDSVFWAIKAVKCTELKSVVGLPKLVDVMSGHKNDVVRAAAIQAMPKFGNENVKRIAYLLVKRISEKETGVVIEAAAKVLERVGDDERKWALNRLKNLLENSEELSSDAARVLTREMKREDLVAEYVVANLPGEPTLRRKAVGMVCYISKENQAVIEPQVENIVATVTTGKKEDPGVKALDCLGNVGLQAIRKEVIQPKHLKKVIAATALADMDLRGKPDALVTIEACSQDDDAEVRKLCSQSLGKIGAPALPKILEMLNSNETGTIETGKHALSFFTDPAAREDLLKVRANNSGWMANNRKLEIAEAIDQALTKLQ